MECFDMFEPGHVGTEGLGIKLVCNQTFEVRLQTGIGLLAPSPTKSFRSRKSLPGVIKVMAG